MWEAVSAEKVWNRWPVHNLSVIVSYYYPNMNLSIVRNMQNSGPKFASIPINYMGIYIIRDQNQIACPYIRLRKVCGLIIITCIVASSRLNLFPY